MATKGTLLYGGTTNSADANSAVEFITKMLDAVTAIHKAHLMTTGPGSFAAHEALGEVYGNLEDGLDNLAESFMGCKKLAWSSLVWMPATTLPKRAKSMTTSKPTAA